MPIRVASFNCENLFARFKFRKNYSPEEAIASNGFTINKLKFDFYGDSKRHLTAKAIKALKADVIAFQEVEDLDVLERFRNNLLGGFRAFPFLMLIDSNDPRYIDVAVLSRLPIVHARSYQHLKNSPRARSFIFSRDCLEVDIQTSPGKVITLFVNHFKSMIGGRAETKARRLGQVKAVKEIIQDRFGPESPGDKHFIVLGDFNDYIEEGRERESSLPELVHWDHVENVVERLPEEQRWTHYYSRNREYRQLDYVLVPRSLTTKVNSVEIERRGMPKRAECITQKRFLGVGQDNPKASDHCPVLVELEI